MRCRGKHMDTYINGTIVNRHSLDLFQNKTMVMFM